MTDDLIERMVKEYQRVDHERQGLNPYEAMRAAWAVAAEPTEAMKVAGREALKLAVLSHYQLWAGEGLEDIWQAMHGAADGLDDQNPADLSDKPA